MTPIHFQRLILKWFDLHGRKTLPWQQNKTPYRVWISEIMLQQTQVSTVIPYFLRFMESFPKIEALADASEDQVLHHWTGLGYYNRARNLHASAKIIVSQFKGKLPDELSALEALPGIGRSTAGAILSLAFESSAAILDGNVKRVLTRFHGITTWSGEKTTLEQLWQLAEKYTPKKRIADYTQAMMDIGATVCTRSKPLCSSCPLIKNCTAYAQDLQTTIPLRKPTKSIPVQQKTFLILIHKNKVLLEKRPPTGVWAKLWSLPEITGFAPTSKIKIFCRRYTPIDQIKLGTIFRHTFSHFHLDIQPAFIKVKSLPAKLMENDEQIWYNLANPQAIGLPQPIKKLIEAI